MTIIVTLCPAGYPARYPANNPASMRVCGHKGYPGYPIPIKNQYSSNTGGTQRKPASTMRAPLLGKQIPLIPYTLSCAAP